MPSRATQSPPPAQGAVAIPVSSMLRSREFGLSVLLFIAVFLVYLPSLSADFIWDDDDYVTKNLTLRNLHGLWRIWFEPTATPQYYPLVHTTFWIENHLWGLNPQGYHFVNIVLHATNSVLVAMILRKLNCPGAWLAATLFGLHPVHVESVSWVTERKNVLSAFFYLLSMSRFLNWWGIHASFLDGSNQRSPKATSFLMYIEGLLFYVAALLSKSVTCSLPAVLLLILWQKKGKVTVRDLGFLAPLFVVGIGLSINTIWLERTKVGASGEGFDFTISDRILIAGRAIWFYAGKLIFPWPLSFIYPRWSLTSDNPLGWCAVISAALIPIVMFLWTRRMTAPLVAVLFFYGTLVPALGFFNIYPMRFSFVADHFQYLASLGVISLVAGFFAERFKPEKSGRNFIRFGISTLVVVILATITWQRQFVFKNPYLLWTDTLAKNPTCMLAHWHLGKIAVNSRKFALAEAHFRDVHRYRTDNIHLANDLREWAAALAGQRKYEEANEKLRQSLEVEPSYFDALNDWGTYEAEQGHFETAIQLFEKALAENPGKDPYDRGYARLNLATSLWNAGRTENAERELRAAMKEAPDDSPKHFLIAVQSSLAQILVQQGKLAEAEQVLIQVLKWNPDSENARQLLQEIQRKSQLNPPEK